jgi:hypothetical protein
MKDTLYHYSLTNRKPYNCCQCYNIASKMNLPVEHPVVVYQSLHKVLQGSNKLQGLLLSWHLNTHAEIPDLVQKTSTSQDIILYISCRLCTSIELNRSHLKALLRP